MVSKLFTFLRHHILISQLFAIIMFGEICNTTKVDNFIRQYPWNQALIDTIKDEYEVVFPFQQREEVRTGVNTRNYLFVNGTYHFHEITVVVRSSHGRMKLNLELNQWLVPSGATFKELLADKQPSVTRNAENCYYQGKVHGDPSSSVALSSCAGLRGVIFTRNGTFGLVGLRGGDGGRRHPHLLFKTTWHEKAACANGDHSDWAPSLARKSGAARSSRAKRDAGRQTKYAEVAIVADYGMAKQFEFVHDNVVRYALEIVNIADMIFRRDMNTRLAVVYMETWMRENSVALASDVTPTLLNVVDYVSAELYEQKKDLSLFLTGHKFARHEVTMSTPGAVCTARAAGLVTSDNPYLPHETGLIVAHNIGHILGVKHDQVMGSCACDKANGCLMRSDIGGKRGHMTSAFSQCSVNDFRSSLEAGHIRCLFNRPLEEDSLRHCGNGIVDAGEDCDCGGLNDCDDPCCDPVTCRLKAAAQCSIKDPCCDQCKLLPAGRLCRQGDDLCDVPEVCDGKSGSCPADSHKVNGAACGVNGGMCWRGQCADMDAQCQRIWGKSAKAAEKACFERFNSLAVEHGNCGKKDDGSYRRCDLRNSVCGMLHCQNGSSSATDSRWMSFNSKFTENGRQLECKIITDERMGMVRDGTRCLEGGVCLSGACIPQQDVSPVVECPTNNLALQCSGHGACTTSTKCFCNPGWMGDSCDQRIPGWSPSASTPPNPLTNLNQKRSSNPFDLTANNLDTPILLGILGIVGLILFLFLVCLLLCYRRRTSSELHKKKMLERELDKNSDSSIDTNQRSIKFGSMPSYRDEKRKRRKNKRVYDALQRINEASDERDTVSVKSRESRESAPTAVGLPNDRYSATPDTVLRSAPMPQPPTLPPERGILKNGYGSNSDTETMQPLLLAGQSDHHHHHYDTRHVYDVDGQVYANASQPCRVFERSLRQLDECRPSPRSQRQQHYLQSPSKSDFLPPRSLNISGRSPHTLRAAERREMALFSPTAVRSRHPGFDRGGYATDTEIGYSPRLTVRRDDASDISRRSSETDPNGPFVMQQPRANSPANSVASSRSRLGKPEPLKLRNIEYLLKQLDPNASNSFSLSDKESESELSPAEADRNEQCSNTESTREENRRADFSMDSHDPLRYHYHSNETTPAGNHPDDRDPRFAGNFV